MVIDKKCCDGIIRGTTPTITFYLPVEMHDLRELELVIRQGNYAVMTFGMNRVYPFNGVYAVKLTQEETLILNPKLKFDIQLKYITNNDDVWSSPIRRYPVYDTLKEVVM